MTTEATVLSRIAPVVAQAGPSRVWCREFRISSVAIGRRRRRVPTIARKAVVSAVDVGVEMGRQRRRRGRRRR